MMVQITSGPPGKAGHGQEKNRKEEKSGREKEKRVRVGKRNQQAQLMKTVTPVKTMGMREKTMSY